MRILIIAQQWEPEEGTPQRRWAPLVEELTARGHTVDVITPPPHYPGGVLNSNAPEVQRGAVAPGNHGETVWRCNFTPHTQSLASRLIDQIHIMFSSARLGGRLIRQKRPDIILATAPPLPAAFSALLLWWRHRVPYVLDLRDAWPDLLKYVTQWDAETEERNRRNPLYALAMRTAAGTLGWLLKKSLKHAAAITTTAPSFSELLRARGFKNVLSVRNLGSVFPSPVVPRDPHEDGSLRVLYAGTTGRAQGLHSAIEAVKRVQASGVDLQMRVIGSGASLVALKELAVGTGIEFFGRLPHSDVVEHYEWADTCLVHLRDWEPLQYTVPSKLYESLSSGRHTTVAANGEVFRIITETEAGVAVPAMDPQALADSWIALADDPRKLDVADRGAKWLSDRETQAENASRFADFVEKAARE